MAQFQVVIAGTESRALVDTESTTDQVVFGERTSGGVDRRLLLLQDAGLLLLPVEAAGGLSSEDKAKAAELGARIADGKSSDKEEFSAVKWFWYRASASKTPVAWYQLSSDQKTSWNPGTQTLTVQPGNTSKLWDIIRANWERPWRAEHESKHMQAERLSEMSLDAGYAAGAGSKPAAADEEEITLSEDDEPMPPAGAAARPGEVDDDDDQKMRAAGGKGEKRKAADDSDEDSNQAAKQERKVERGIEFRRRILIAASHDKLYLMSRLIAATVPSLNSDDGRGSRSRIETSVDFIKPKDTWLVPQPKDVVQEIWDLADIRAIQETARITTGDRDASLLDVPTKRMMADTKDAEARSACLQVALCLPPYDLVITSLQDDNEEARPAEYDEWQRELIRYLQFDNEERGMPAPPYGISHWLEDRWYRRAVANGLIDRSRVIVTCPGPGGRRERARPSRLAAVKRLEEEGSVFIFEEELASYLSVRWKKRFGAVRDDVAEALGDAGPLSKLIADYAVSGKSVSVGPRTRFGAGAGASRGGKDQDGDDSMRAAGGKEEASEWKKKQILKRKRKAQGSIKGAKPAQERKIDRSVEFRRKILVASQHASSYRHFASAVARLNTDNGLGARSRIEVSADFILPKDTWIGEPDSYPRMSVDEEDIPSVERAMHAVAQTTKTEQVLLRVPTAEMLADYKNVEARQRCLQVALCQPPYDLVIVVAEMHRVFDVYDDEVEPERPNTYKSWQREVVKFLQFERKDMPDGTPVGVEHWLDYEWYLSAVKNGLTDKSRVIFTLPPTMNAQSKLHIAKQVEQDGGLFVNGEELAEYLSVRWKKRFGATRDSVADALGTSSPLSKLIADYAISGKPAIARVQGTDVHLEIPAAHARYSERVLVRGKHTLYRLKKRC